MFSRHIDIFFSEKFKDVTVYLEQKRVTCVIGIEDERPDVKLSFLDFSN